MTSERANEEAASCLLTCFSLSQCVARSDLESIVSLCVVEVAADMGSLAGSEPPRTTGSGGLLVATRPTRCLLLLQRCLAIRLQRVSTLGQSTTPVAPRSGHEYWMYDSGYRLFQVRKHSFLPFLTSYT